MFGVVVLEVMVLGLVIIVIECGGLIELVLLVDILVVKVVF